MSPGRASRSSSRPLRTLLMKIFISAFWTAPTTSASYKREKIEEFSSELVVVLHSRTMAQRTSDTDRITKLDSLLRGVDQGPFEMATVSTKEGVYAYTPWYSYALTSLALLTAEDELAYGQAELTDSGLAKIVVFTSTLVVTANVDTVEAANARPFAEAFPRRTLTSLALQAGQGVDQQGSRAVGWPEQLVIELKYEGREDAITLRGNAFDPFAQDNIGAVWTLLTKLREDLAGRN